MSDGRDHSRATSSRAAAAVAIGDDIPVSHHAVGVGEASGTGMLVDALHQTLPVGTVAANAHIPGSIADEDKLDLPDRSFAVGDFIVAQWRRGEAWYPGKITRVHNNSTFDIKYDDNDKEKNVPFGFISYDGEHYRARILPAAVNALSRRRDHTAISTTTMESHRSVPTSTSASSASNANAQDDASSDLWPVYRRPTSGSRAVAAAPYIAAAVVSEMDDMSEAPRVRRRKTGH